MRATFRLLFLLGAMAIAPLAQAQGICSTEPVTASKIREQLLGEYFSLGTLVITQNNPATAALTIMGGRLYLFSNSSAYVFYDRTTGLITFGAEVKNALGGNWLSDYWMSAQNDARPVAVSDIEGFRHICAAALVGTCGVANIVQGTTQCLQATATSRTRYCTCTSNGAGTPAYAWALNFGAGTVGDSTTCPEVTP